MKQAWIKGRDSLAARAMSRRTLLANGLAGLVAGATGLVIGQEAEAAKATKQQASYQYSPKNNHRCSSCRFFIKPNSCQLVAGTISPNGWCKFFQGAA